MNIKISIVNANNRLNRVFPFFIPFSSEFLLKNRLIDIYSSYFSFHSTNKCKKGSKAHIWKLDDLILQALDLKTATIIFNVSIKNQVVTLIAYIYVHNNLAIKTLHHVVNIRSTEAELFAIRCSINQATQLADINCIVVIIDLLHTTKWIFDLLVYTYQIYLAIISRELREFFIRDQQNSIKFWKCLSYDK